MTRIMLYSLADDADYTPTHTPRSGKRQDPSRTPEARATAIAHRSARCIKHGTAHTRAGRVRREA